MSSNPDNDPWKAPYVGVNPILHDADPRDQGFHGGNVGAMYAKKKIDSWLPDNLNRPLTAAEAQAMIANLINNPIQATKGTFLIDNESWFSRAGGGGIASFPGRPGYHIDDPNIADQTAEPTNPGLRTATASTYGKVIPISFGRRRLDGNVIQSSTLVPSLVGNVTKNVTYDIPIYEDPPLLDDTTTEINDETTCTYDFRGCTDRDTDIDLLHQGEVSRETTTTRIANEAGPGYVDVQQPTKITTKTKDKSGTLITYRYMGT